MHIPRCRHGRPGRRTASSDSGSSPAPVNHRIVAINVSDDGISLTGRRYAGFLTTVAERQQRRKPQDMVTIWLPQPGEGYVTGIPRINAEGELEVLDPECVVQGTVREVGGHLCFFPA